MATELTQTHRRWRVKIFAATWMSYAGFYFCRKTFGIVKVPLKEMLQVNDYELAHIWTAYLAAYMIGQFVSGWVGRRTACRSLLLVGMMLSLCCNLAFGGLTLVGPQAYWPFLGLMVLNGFAQSTGWPGNIGVLAHWFRREERGTIMGFWATCYQLGSVAAKSFAAVVFGWLGLAWSFWGAAAVLFVIWLFFYFVQRDTPEELGLDSIVEEIVIPAEQNEAQSSRALGSDLNPALIRSILMMGCAYFSFKFLRYGIDSWAPMVIEETFPGTSTTQAGLISTAFDWVGFTGVIVAGWATDRFSGGRRATVTFVWTLGMVLATAALWGVGQSSVLAFGLCLSLVGFTLFGPDSLLSGVGAIDVGSKRSAMLAAGVVNGMGSLGPILQEELIGFLKVHHGMNAVFVLLFAVSLIGALGTGILWSWGRSGKSSF